MNQVKSSHNTAACHLTAHLMTNTGIIQIVTGTGVITENYFPEVGKILPKAIG